MCLYFGRFLKIILIYTCEISGDFIVLIYKYIVIIISKGITCDRVTTYLK